MYKLVYLPVAREDMVDIVRYVSHELGNPQAAERLAEALIAAAESIPPFPYANPVYTPIRPLRHEYRRLPVQNYLLFYWVDQTRQQINIARVIYAKRDYGGLLN